MADLVPQLALEILGAIAATAVALGMPYIVLKFKEIGEFKVTLHGIDGVESINGIVGLVELLNDEVEDNHEDIRDIEGDIDNIKEKVHGNTEDIDDIQDTVMSNEEEIRHAQQQVAQINKRIDILYTDIQNRNDGN